MSTDRPEIVLHVDHANWHGTAYIRGSVTNRGAGEFGELLIAALKALRPDDDRSRFEVIRVPVTTVEPQDAP
jgi:hypothetical protein